MWRSYFDIVERLGEPEWWDDNGTPRYCEFTPLRATIYEKYVAFVDVECQGCDRVFRVAVTQPEGRLSSQNEWMPTELPSATDIGSFHLGDPPRHEHCHGESMNIYTLAILEFWERDPMAKFGADPWVRRPELEFFYGPGVT